MSKGVHGADHSLNYYFHIYIFKYLNMSLKKKQSKINHQCAVVKDINLALCHCCYVMIKKICRQ